MNPTSLSEQALLAHLQWRYATKVFDPARKIPVSTWKALQESLVLSPSSFGLQPYRFLDVQNPGVRQQLLTHSWNQRQTVEASRLVVFAARTSLTAEEIDRFLKRVSFVRGIPVESLKAYRDMMTGMLLKEEFKPVLQHWATRQAFIALGNLLTSAALLNVDACPMEGFIASEYDRILNLSPRGLTAVVCCALGYRSEADKYATQAKVRMPLEELIQVI